MKHHKKVRRGVKRIINRENRKLYEIFRDGNIHVFYNLLGFHLSNCCAENHMVFTDIQSDEYKISRTELKVTKHGIHVFLISKIYGNDGKLIKRTKRKIGKAITVFQWHDAYFLSDNPDSKFLFISEGYN